MQEGYLFEVNTTANWINDRYLFDFSRRDNYLLAVVNGNAVKLYDQAGIVFQELGNHAGRVNALDISPDERFIATASSDNKVNIWYYNLNINQFIVYDSLTAHRNAVRSCQFNNLSDYILTASDDSLTALWKLNGEGYLVTGHGTRIRPLLPREYEYAFNQYILGRKCDAVFSTDQESIAITVYQQKDSAAPEYRYYIVHARNSIFSNTGESYYVYPYLHSTSIYQPVMDYQSLVPSANDTYIAMVVKGGEITNLVAPDALLVRKFEGIQPDFSSDGKYLICIQDSILHKYVIDVEEIRRLVYEEKIFGELEIDYQDWITY